MTEEKEKSFINKIGELENDNKALQKEINSLQGFLTKSVNENTKLENEIACLHDEILSLKDGKAKSDLFKFLFLSMISGIDKK